MAATTLTLSALLKNVYLPGITSWINNNRPIFRRLEKITDKSRFVGSKFVFAAKKANTQGIGARAEGAEVPDPQNTSLVNMELQMAHHYGVIQLTAQAMAQASRSEGAFAEAIDLEVTGCRDELEQDLSVHSVFGHGRGHLGRVSSISGTTVTMRSQPTVVGEPGTRFIRNGAVVDFYTALTAGSQSGDSVTTSAVSYSANTFVISAAGTVAAGDYVFREDSRGNTVTGLAGILDDGSRVSTFQTLSRATHPQLQANMLSAGGVLRAWTPTLMDQLAQEAWASAGGNGGYPSAFYCQIEIQRRAADYIRADRRVDMAVMKLDNGYESVAWTCPDGNKPWFADQAVVPNEVWAVQEPDLFWGVLEDFQWEDRDGSMWVRDAGRTHAFEAWLFTFRNLGARRCNSMSVMEDVSLTL